MAKNIFRQSALNQITSMDQLEQSMVILQPHVWVIPAAIAVLITAVLIWAVTGSIPSKVPAQGVFINSSGLTGVRYPSSGIIKNVFVNQGDAVIKGEVIARVERQDVLEQIQIEKNKLANLQRLYEATSNYSERNTGLTREMLEKMEKDLNAQLTVVKQRVSDYQRKEQQMKNLFDQGLITEIEYFSARNDLLNIQKDQQGIEQKLLDVGVSKIKNKGEADQQLMNLDHQINETKLQLETQLQEYEKVTRIVTNASGWILELPIEKGVYINPSQTVAVISRYNASGMVLEARLYVSAMLGKKIKPGMKIAINPTTIKQEEYGYIEGIVTEVSQLPVSDDYIFSRLQNKSFVHMFAQIADPIELRASLVVDPTTVSGYKWSSSKGPAEQMENGMVCTGSVIVKEQHPIELVIPFLKKKVLGVGDK